MFRKCPYQGPALRKVRVVGFRVSCLGAEGPICAQGQASPGEPFSQLGSGAPVYRLLQVMQLARELCHNVSSLTARVKAFGGSGFRV